MPNEQIAVPVCNVSMNLQTSITGLLWRWGIRDSGPSFFSLSDFSHRFMDVYSQWTSEVISSTTLSIVSTEMVHMLSRQNKDNLTKARQKFSALPLIFPGSPRLKGKVFTAMKLDWLHPHSKPMMYTFYTAGNRFWRLHSKSFNIFF